MLGIIATIVSDSDREFILSIYKKFYPQMKYQILHVVGKCNDADDLIQDTVIRLIAHIELLKALQENQIMMYAVKTAKSVALDYMRKNLVRSKWRYYPEEYEEIVDKADTPEEICIKKESRTELWETVDGLSERDRDLIYFKYQLDLSMDELCEVLNISEKSIRQCLFRARKRVRTLMMGGGDCEK